MTKDVVIKNLKYLGKKEVFATKTTNGWFLANGVVVSNCDSLAYAPQICAKPYDTSGYKYEDEVLYPEIGC